MSNSQLIPVDYNPFAESTDLAIGDDTDGLIPVDYDPFADADSGFFSEIGESAQRGFKSLGQLRNLYGMELGENPDENIRRIAELEREKRLLQPPASVRKFAESESFGDAFDAFLDAPLDVTANLAVESLAQFLPGIPLAAGLGAAGGTITAGPVGSIGGTALGVGATSFLIEYGNKILEVVGEQGVDLTDPEQLKAAFASETLMDAARERAVAKGVPIAIFDAISGGIAGRLFKPAKSMAGKALHGVGEVGAQAGLGMASHSHRACQGDPASPSSATPPRAALDCSPRLPERLPRTPSLCFAC